MAIRIPYSLGVGTQLLMRLRLPPQTKELVMRAQIIRAANGPVTGIRFVEFSGQAKGQLHEWLSLRLEEIIPSLSKHSA